MEKQIIEFWDMSCILEHFWKYKKIILSEKIIRNLENPKVFVSYIRKAIKLKYKNKIIRKIEIEKPQIIDNLPRTVSFIMLGGNK
jgi:hypothetical protein